MTLGEKIKRLRMESSLSQEILAEMVGVSRQAVTKWENNISYPSTENMIKLAEIFGVSMEELICRDENSDSQVRRIYYIIKTEESIIKKSKHNRILNNIKCAFEISFIVFFCGNFVSFNLCLL